MPKPFTRNKKSVPASAHRHGYGERKPVNVKDLLESSGISGKKLRQYTDKKTYWSDVLRQILEPALFGHITNIVERVGTLTLYTSSSAWSARLRFAVAECAARLPLQSRAIQQILVRVKPG